MVASVMTWCLVAALGQVPSPPEEAAWLKAVPADADVVLRLRGIEPVRDDLIKMLEAMSPTAAARAKPALQRGLEQIRTGAGGAAAVQVEAPVLALIRLPKPEAPPTPTGPPFATFVRTKDYAALQQSVAGPGQGPKPQARPGGYDALTDPNGNTLFTFQGDDFAVVSNDEELIRAIAQPKAALDPALSAELRGRLLGGDAGLYVNLAAVRTRYGDQLEQLRQRFLAAVEKGAAGAGGPKVGVMVRGIYGGFFETLKDSQALALSVELAAEGLVLTGRIAVAPDSPSARRLADARTGTADLLARLPADATFFLDINVDPASYQALQRLGLSFLSGTAIERSADFQKAMSQQRQAGPRQIAGATALGREGMRSLSLMTFADPRKAVESFDLTFRAIRAEDAGVDWIKEITVQPAAESYRGFSLSRATMTLDLEKLAQFQPNTPGGAAGLRTLLGETITTWYGTDGRLVLSIAANDWAEARSRIDAATTGGGSIGQTPGFRAVRSRLPDRLSGAFLLSAQGLVRQMSAQLSAVNPDNPNLKAPHDLPKDPALLGGALSPVSDGYQFQAVVPGAVGPVIEQGLIPLFQGLGGQVTR